MEPLRQDNPDWEPVAAAPKAEEGKVESVPVWGLVRRAWFRFLFSYLVLYNFPFPLSVIPVYGEILKESYTENWHAVVPWVGEHVLGVKARFHPSGSGDTAYNYVLLFCCLILALAAACPTLAAVPGSVECRATPPNARSTRSPGRGPSP